MKPISFLCLRALLDRRFSTAIGGTEVDAGMGIAVDDNGHAYIVSYIYSGDYPTTPGDPPATNTNGDVILSRINFHPTAKYCYAGSQRIAMREQGKLHYLFGDHLGSTSITIDADGILVGELRYRAYSETRHTWGDTPTDFRYTGQREESGIGLYYYNARWYDSRLGRFAQADTIVPDPSPHFVTTLTIS